MLKPVNTKKAVCDLKVLNPNQNNSEHTDNPTWPVDVVAN